MEDILIKSKKSFQAVSTTLIDTADGAQIYTKEAEKLSSKQKEDQLTDTATEVTQEQLALGKRLLNWRTLVPLAIVIIALVFITQKLNINPQKTWSAIQHANLFFLLAAFIIYYLSFGLRALRWNLLLQNVGFRKENGIHLPGLKKLTEIVYISFFANAIVPAKLGDLYRAYLLRQEIGVSTTRSFGTVLAERLLDLVVLLLLFIPAIQFSLGQQLPTQIRSGIWIVLGAVIAGIIGLFILRLTQASITKILPLRFHDQYYHFHEGTLGSFRRLPQLTGLTVSIWSCEALRFFFIAVSLSLISGNVLHILLATIVIGLSEALLTALPTTGGGVGVVEAGMALVIALFYRGADVTNQIFAAIILDRLISYFSILAIGLVVFLIAFGKTATQSKR
jgi:glycosyltransferase 2 family protein